MQKIEVIRIHRFDNDGPIKAFCDVQFNEEFIVKGFKVVEGNEGLFIGYPSQVSSSGKWFNTFMPIDPDFKTRLEKVVIQAYEE